ncbi:transcriptional regulator with XRE-family HTH domain [Actinokineospora baliensis]|uniref:helix-turn-helix domain-containing protein n=1 Tax=Actinokineospora baliensis TaxID=547056 RepID=UPI00195B2D29|nr:helix-turn-helix transcriptional regulator [Actinokineospora baliensis]MBM7776460.1 transcriptional regulator with XRE-family HTH domain [Actinokineospora baliensis]
MTSPSRSISMQRRLLGAELLRLREVAGLTQEEAAEHLGKAGNKISRVESGKIGIDKTDLDVILQLYRATEKDRLWCIELSRLSRPKRGRPTGETTLYLGPRWFRAFRDLETDATEIMRVGAEIIPGNLQTDDYIRAMFEAEGVDSADHVVDDALRVRADRRTLLTREAAAGFAFVLSESALRRQIGGPLVMAAQLRHLAEIAMLPNVTLQIIPFDAQSYAHLCTDFTLFRFGHEMADDIVYLEMYSDAAYLDKPPETVRRYRELFARLQGVALGPVESRHLVATVAEQYAAVATTGR